jgi:hypothetical protein
MLGSPHHRSKSTSAVRRHDDLDSIFVLRSTEVGRCGKAVIGRVLELKT